MIITIDGPVATGKTTIARKLAESIGFIFFDTGAMYRIVTYAILKEKINFESNEELEKFLATFDFDIKVVKHEKHYHYQHEDITLKIREDSVTSMVSKIAAKKQVREKLTKLQRELATGVNAVFEGRDMGSEVFPDAAIKIFLTGRDEVRAKRRYDELKHYHSEDSANLTLLQCLEEIIKRDEYDSKREHSPLRKPENAFVIDTSDLTVEEIVFKILEHKESIKTLYTTEFD